MCTALSYCITGTDTTSCRLTPLLSNKHAAADTCLIAFCSFVKKTCASFGDGVSITKASSVQP